MSTTTATANKRGIELLRDPSLNKSTAFTESEREALGLVGLVPDATESEDLQLQRVIQQLGHKTTDRRRLWNGTRVGYFRLLLPGLSSSNPSASLPCPRL